MLFNALVRGDGEACDIFEELGDSVVFSPGCAIGWVGGGGNSFDTYSSPGNIHRPLTSS